MGFDREKHKMKGGLPVHFYIPEKSLEQGEPIPDLEKLRGDGVTCLWLESEKADEASPASKIAASGALPVVSVINNPALVPALLKSGVSGIAVRTSKVRELLRHVKSLSNRGVDVYLLVDERDISLAGGYLSVFDEIKMFVLGLREGGIGGVYINASHSDTVANFNINKHLKALLGARHVISAVDPVGGHRKGVEKNTSARAAGLAGLFYEEIGDVLLLRLPHGLRATRANLLAQLEPARKALGPLGFFPTGITVISCPTCGRCGMDLVGMTGTIDRALKDLEREFAREGRRVEDTGGITVAVMGCNVNGPGEAKGADLGIAGRNDGSGVIFRNGRPFKSLPEGKLVDELVLHTKNLIEDRLAVRFRSK
jgi:hypothetical protein